MLAAVAVAAMLHGALVVLLGFSLHGAPRSLFPGAAWGDIDPWAASSEETAYVDLVTIAPEAASREAAIPSPTDPAALAADQARSAERESAPSTGVSRSKGLAASDVGEGTGRNLPPAFRTDQSTLRARLSDGADTYQLARVRTGRRASSPQAIRQETRTGTGDSIRAREPGSLPATMRTTPSADDVPADLTLALRNPDNAAGRDESRGEGPLDAEKGARRFDVETKGVAVENDDTRAASNEFRPGRLDLSEVSARGAGEAGRGPSETPGVISQVSSGVLSTVRGGPSVVPRGADLEMTTAEREYQRFLHEIRRRVDAALRWPKRLALMLEQGEVVVHFVVRPDGRLAGTVKVIKSAGFAEFDAEAISAVTRAAPFPALRRTLSVSMPIAFDNPVVR